MTVPDSGSVLVPGRWTHREISANGVRLHVAEAGSGPLVLLLHGFPEFWWSWRHQLVDLADAGYRAVAPDLRGYGASDKPPRGYDAFTLAGDVAGLIRALGERDAVVVGHGWGGALGWTAATLHPRVVRRLAVLSTPHPMRLRSAALAGPRGQLRAFRHALAFQLPRYAESRLTRDGGWYVRRLLHDWSGPRWRRTDDHAAAAARYADALRIPTAAHCALEYYRWAIRSLPRPDGLRYARLMQQPVTAPTLQLHGGLDPCLLPQSAQGSGRYVAAAYQWRLLPGLGHFPHEEDPALVSGELIRWAKES
ncbi:MAG: alpha/beta hydrolase [Actinobacteria bacterium]|nr:alpha/beta hydrolase [Actinomycetota bacterium]MBI3686377.1 alpha/beta hydrolase [Actinomycetota bacterium]